VGTLHGGGVSILVVIAGKISRDLPFGA